MISISFFLGFSLSSFCANLVFYVYKRRSYYLNRIKLLIFGLIIITTCSLISNLPFFLTNSADLFIDKEQGFFVPTIIFNLANIIYSASVILFLLSLLNVDEKIIDLEMPPQLSNKQGDISIGRILKGNAKKQKFYLKDLVKSIHWH